MPEVPKQSDQVLIALLREGDANSLDELFRRYYEMLCLLSVRIVKDADAAEDIVQDFFLSIWEKRSVLPVIDRVAPYFKRSVRNRSLNFLRDPKRLPTGDDEQLPELKTAHNAASETLELEELRARVDTAIDGLPERCRLVFVLSKFGEMKHKEIAEALGISVKTVENQMGRAYQQLRKVLSALILFSVIIGP